jgi:BNR repeat-like domain
MLNRRQFLHNFSGAALAAMAASARGAEPAIRSWVAIQNVCAWPKLERLTDGTLLAVIFNQPCHGLWEGDLDCWASRDDGRTWRFRARVARHESTQARMNCAVGKARNGDLIALCGGWSDRNPPFQPSAVKSSTLRPLVSRSADGGHTWKITGSLPEPPSTELGKDNQFIPFGQVEQAADGSLCAAVYLKRGKGRQGFLLRSADDGKTWDDRVVLHPYGNETAILHLGKGKWIAACREFQAGRNEIHLEQYVSADDGRVWTRRQPLTLPGQMPGNLLRLSDGRILLAYGNRNWNNCGVDARVSQDEGNTWGEPFRIANVPMRDSGYPSSIQLPGGDIVTVYYTKVSEDFHYEMRVARWTPPKIGPAPE